MKSIVKKIIGCLILIALFSLWFIGEVIEHGVLVTIIGLVIFTWLFALLLLALYLIMSD